MVWRKIGNSSRYRGQGSAETGAAAIARGIYPNGSNYLTTMGGSWLGPIARLSARALVSPRLAVDLLRTAWAFRRRDWWRKPPFLPLPDRTYLKGRMYTPYADKNA